MARYWFRPKKFGFGASPSTWQGWAVGVAYVVGLLAVSVALVPMGEALSPGRFALWTVLVIAGTAATIFIAWRKTEGQWQWRWAKRNAPQEK